MREADLLICELQVCGKPTMASLYYRKFPGCTAFAKTSQLRPVICRHRWLLFVYLGP